MGNKIINFENNQIKIEQTFDFTEQHKESLTNLVNTNIFECRGSRHIDHIHLELELMGLANPIEDAWHVSWEPSQEGKRIASQLL